jgi:hypothetical protein
MRFGRERLRRRRREEWSRCRFGNLPAAINALATFQVAPEIPKTKDRFGIFSLLKGEDYMRGIQVAYCERVILRTSRAPAHSHCQQKHLEMLCQFF